MSQMLVAADLILGPTWEIVALGSPDKDATREILESLWATFIPRRVVACRTADDSTYRSALLDPLFAGKSPRNAQPTVYVCEGFACQEPVVGTSRDRRHVD